MKVVCISDTHNRTPHVPDGDILVHAGDLTMSGSLAELERAAFWLGGLPHAHKVVIAGNHDWCFARQPAEARAIMVYAGLTYLEDEEADVGGLRVYGSPWQPWFHNWAFNLPRGQDISSKWDRIPSGLDILVTHGPPWGKGDEVHGGFVGCEDLLVAVCRTSPRLHVFGHIHEGYGVYEDDPTTFVNAAMLDERCKAQNPAIVVDLDPAAPADAHTAAPTDAPTDATPPQK